MEECLFCRIAAGSLPSDVVYEDTDVIAIRDINPQAPVHILVISRKHIPGFEDATEDNEKLLGHVARAAALVAQQEGVSKTGYRSVVNSGPDAQQSVPHLHMHVLGGRAMTWPPG